MSHDLSNNEPEYATPLASALLTLSASDVKSFHTLPLSGGRSIQTSTLRNQYDQLFGADYLRSDLTISGKQFDTFFSANRSFTRPK